MFSTGVTTDKPLEKVYVLAPLGIIVNEFPSQIAPLFTVIIGDGLTVTSDIAITEETQPFKSLPDTEKEVVVNGFTIADPLEKV